MEASPEEKRDHGKRQAQSKVYLYWIKVGVSFGHPARLEDFGTHKCLKSFAISFEYVLSIGEN